MGYVFTLVEQIAYVIEKIHLPGIGKIAAGLTPYKEDG